MPPSAPQIPTALPPMLFIWETRSLFDEAGEDSVHYLQRGFVGDTLAPDESSGNILFGEPVSDYFAAAVDNDDGFSLLLERDNILKCWYPRFRAWNRLFLRQLRLFYFARP